MTLGVDAAHWWGPVGYFYRGLLDNALADPFGGLVTLILVSVIIKAGRKWWARLARRLWAKHQHHAHRVRDWWHQPVTAQAERHHAAVTAQAARHHAETMAAHHAAAAKVPG